jgi:Flp pilus assembly protein TadD
MQLGELRRRKGEPWRADFEAELEDLAHVVAIKPADVGARIQRGVLLLRLGRAAEALESLEAAGGLAPDHPGVRRFLPIARRAAKGR